MNFIAFIYVSLHIFIKCSNSKSVDQCTKSISYWDSIKYPYVNVLQTVKLQSEPLKCAGSKCCNADLLKEMSGISDLKLKRLSEEKLEFLLTMFSNDSYVLMNLFLNDLDNTKTELNQLFSTTYKQNYEIHKVFFYNWFDKLKAYMEGRLHNIRQLLDVFFVEMVEKIMRLLIPEESDPEIAKCQTKQLIEAKPYQETDLRLKANVIKSYPPSRLLVNAIAIGRDAFKQLMKKTSPAKDCLERFNTAFHCMLCNGETVKSCPMTCRSVLENCFGSIKYLDLKKLDKILNKYIKSITLLAAKLDNQFNFPNVNQKMSVHLSTAIMNVQNVYQNLKEQIKTKCQKGGAIRDKRQMSKEFNNWQKSDRKKENSWLGKNIGDNFNNDIQTVNTLTSQITKPNDFLSPIAQNIKIKYKVVEKYFHKIIPEFCAGSAASTDSSHCWNGSAVIQQSVSLEKSGKKKNEKAQDMIIKNVLNQLNEISMRINDYLSGKNEDPKTLNVENFKVYGSKEESVSKENFKKTNSPMAEGSGDFEKLPLNVPVLAPNKADLVPVEVVSVTVPILPVKQPATIKLPFKSEPKWSLPTMIDGSGDLDKTKSESDDIKTFKPDLRMKNSLNKNPSTFPFKISSQKSVVNVITQPTQKSNPIPDDEDLNPLPNVKVITIKALQTTTPSILIPVIEQPEGSGSNLDSGLPEMKISRIVSHYYTTTKRINIPVKPVEGSGVDDNVKPVIEKPKPVLPMLPNSQSTTSESPVLKNTSINPDEEIEPVEGSGKSRIVISRTSKPEIVTNHSTFTSISSAKSDGYPGMVPSEVWIPGIEGVKNMDKNYQTTTSKKGGNKNCRSSITMVLLFSLVLMYRLL